MVDFETFSKSDFRAVKVLDCKAVPKSKKLLQFTLDDGSGEDRTILSRHPRILEPEELIGKTLIAITNLPPRKMMGIDSSAWSSAPSTRKTAKKTCTCSSSTTTSQQAPSCIDAASVNSCTLKRTSGKHDAKAPRPRLRRRPVIRCS